MNKKFLILTLTANIALAMNALAEESGYCNDEKTCLWTITGDALSITGSGEVTLPRWKNYPYNHTTGITSISIGGNIESIGNNYIFANMTDVTSLTIGNSVTNIGSNAFQGLTAVTNLTIPNSVTSIGTYAFDGMTGVTSLTLNDSITRVEGGTFQNLSSVTNLTIPDSVTYIGGNAFNGMTGVTNLTLGDSIETIDNWAFNGMTGVTGVLTLPDSVTSIGTGAFYRMTGVEKLVISNSVTSIGNSAFEGMSALQTLYCPSTLPEGVTCANKGINASKIKTYEKDTNGVYSIADTTTNPATIRYYSTPENMVSGQTCNNDDGTCAQEAAAYQKAKQDAKLAKAAAKSQAALQAALEDQAMALLASGTICNDIETCKAIVYADYNGTAIKVGIYEYASLADLAAGNHLPKRIYTIDEANKVAGKTNRVSIKYR